MSPYSLNCLSIQLKRSSLVLYFASGPGGTCRRAIPDVGCPNGKDTSSSLVGESDDTSLDVKARYSARLLTPLLHSESDACRGVPAVLGITPLLDAEKGGFRVS